MLCKDLAQPAISALVDMTRRQIGVLLSILEFVIVVQFPIIWRSFLDDDIGQIMSYDSLECSIVLQEESRNCLLVPLNGRPAFLGLDGNDAIALFLPGLLWLEDLAGDPARDRGFAIS